MTVKAGSTKGVALTRRRSLSMLGAAAAGTAVALVAPREAAAVNRSGKGQIKATVLYGAPKSADDFEKYYAENHMPMVYKIKGVKRIELAKPGPGPDGKAPAFYRVTELWWSNMKQFQKVTATPEWKKIVDDVPNFATGGVTILVSTLE